MLGNDLKNTAYPLLRRAMRGLNQSLTPLRAAGGRLRYLSPFPQRFTGAYATFEEAIAAARSNGLAGYDHEEIAEVAFEQMCKVAPWDYPVLFWMRQLAGEVDGLVDAGGHMGTKYRAFRNLMQFDDTFRWVVYDLPSIVQAGRCRAERENLPGLHFVERIADAGPVQLFLGSGLLQYLDVQLSRLITELPVRPQHVILNKVALRKGGTVITLERIGRATVPYQMRDEGVLRHDIEQLGYTLVDRWTIPSLAHVIETHPELGASESAGFYYRLG
ncbi:methyltransferase, TIGR04325 family [Sinorhizobium americanum]|uniref:SAM-dependent methyltransferase n=1 Tax=Sinorhizobium americanum TaxID=194963 RepID=A0A1L3LXC4_9HYPH|nr:methyltransferase, TIGR04325 family [Sinorhizobium americanum]APG94683.1 SAM-dependent methyltransferase [Sinorhizobium americanum]OAP48719.1 hypothetical protein ATC00_23930 [Sinorhizobium americanum]